MPSGSWEHLVKGSLICEHLKTAAVLEVFSLEDEASAVFVGAVEEGQ